MPDIPALLPRLVIERALNRCEYCMLSQTGQEATFHIDHITPVAAGGPIAADNLALACVSCSLRTAAREIARDAQTRRDVPIYQPRRQRWDEHFRWDGIRLVGTTPAGRPTVAALALNRALILAIGANRLHSAGIRRGEPHPGAGHGSTGVVSGRLGPYWSAQRGP